MALSPETLARRRRYGYEPPADLIAAAEANPWRGDPQPTDPTQQPTGPGVVRLAHYLQNRFPIIHTIYTRGPHPDEPHDPSMHYAGRAADLMIATVDGLPDRRGDAVADWLIAHAREQGIQYFIWSGTQWSSATGRTSVYPGPEDHFNHLHVDFTIAGAAGALRWPPSEMGGDGSDWLLVGSAALAAWWWYRRGKKK